MPKAIATARGTASKNAQPSTERSQHDSTPQGGDPVQSPIPASNASAHLTAMERYHYTGAAIKARRPAAPFTQAPPLEFRPDPVVPTTGQDRRTSLPTPLKAGLEYLSRMSMDDVSVHYNSPKPAVLHAHAYAQGTEIHLGPGQEKHLPHEAWHVVQQKQGRVKPTLQMKGGTPLNRDKALEQEADTMGQRAATFAPQGDSQPALVVSAPKPAGAAVVQRFELPGTLELVNALGAVVAAELYRNWPQGRSLGDIVNLVRAAGLRGGLTFAYLTTWSSADALALATAFGTNANHLSAADWVRIARAVGPNTPADTTAFCQIPNWTMDGLLPLVAAFQTGVNGLSAAQWAQIARHVGNDAHADATVFASLAGWSWAGIDPLTTAFAGIHANALSATDWATVAATMGNDQAANTIAFCQVPNWSVSGINQLAGAFVAGPGTLNSAQWATVAARVDPDADGDATAFAQLNGWTWAGIDPLTAAFAQDRNHLTRGDWCTVAGRVQNDHAADAIAFSRLAHWTWNGIDPLTAAFHANANLLPRADWLTVAARMGNDRHAETIAFCQLPHWTWAGINPLSQAFVQNRNGLTHDTWVNVARRMNPDAHADAAAFCQIPHWGAVAINAVALAFAADANHLTRANWIAVAGYMGANRGADTIAFCQLPNWTWNGIDPLSQAFRQDDNGLTRDQWIEVATRVGHDRHAEAVAFCQLIHWSWDGIDDLTTELAANAGVLNSAQWASVAQRVTPNDAAEVVPFARLPNWNWGGVNPLTQSFQQNRNGLSSGQWATVAGRVAPNDHAGVAALCQLAKWSAASIRALADLFSHNAWSLSASDWAAIASRAQANGSADIDALLQAVQINNGGANRQTILAYLTAGGNDFAALTGLLQATAADRTIQQLTALLNGIPDYNGDVVDLAALVQTVQLHNAGTSTDDIENLIGAVGDNGTLDETMALVQTLAGRNTIRELETLIRAIENHNAGTDVSHIDTLLQTVQARNAGTSVVDTTQLINAIGANGSVAATTALINTLGGRDPIVDLSAFVDAVQPHNNGTPLADMDALLQAIEHHHAGTHIAGITGLINTVGANGTVGQMRALVNTVAAHSTFGELSALVTAIGQHNPNTAVAAIDAFVQTLGGVGNVCTELTAIVQAVQHHGTIQQMTAMVAQAVITLGAAHVSDLPILINRNPAQNRPPHVTQLLVAVHPNNRARYLNVVAKLPRFTRQAAPVTPARYYNAVGAPLPGPAGAVFTCNAFAYFYSRHSYGYFDFAIANPHANSMWPVGVNTVNQLDASLPAAIGAGLDPNLGVPNRRNGGNNEVGTTGVGGIIAHLMPIHANVDDSFTGNECAAIDNLRW